MQLKHSKINRLVNLNVLLFVPFGLSLPFVVTPGKAGERRGKVWCFIVTIAIAVVLSVAIEAVQYRFALGRCETDDVLANTLGALLGACAYLLQFPKTKKQ